MFDTVIIGAGPTGLTAAIYASRRMMKALVISKNVGGQVIWASEIKNYPGVEFIRGPELINKMSKQVKDLGVAIKIAEVKKISKNSDGIFTIEAGEANYQAKTVIIAMGLEPKQLNLAKENEFTGKGISYCANCDGPLFKDKTVAVVGGGNAALDAAEVLSKIAKQVYLVYRKDKFRGFESLAAQVQNKSNINILLNSEVSQLMGEKKLTGIKVKNMVDQAEKEVEVEGLFVEIGHKPKTEAVSDIVETDTLGQVIVDLNCQTSQAGIFAAGDVTQTEFKQIIVGCGQGAVAALAAYKYLQSKK
ncbi:MAG: FAD-dependent oxidoreductase [bacterium]|nr:FAD-dependent oxidoreductase [bacterium]